ncbi:MAG: zf-HC2 domain-containing protein [Bryobacteraceae bacterium]
MDHQVAVDTMAAQRYLLGELGHSEREAFEAHFFDCVSCATEIRDTAVFVDNLKVVLREQPARAQQGSPSWWDSLAEWIPFRLAGPVPAMATLALACLAGYQRFVEIPAMRMAMAPRPSVTAIVDPLGVRAAGKTIAVPAGELYAVVPFSFDVPAGAASVRLDFYRGERTEADAAPIHSATIEVAADNAGTATYLSIPLPLEVFGEGGFTATASVRRGGAEGWSGPAERYQFQIVRR